MSQVTTSGSVLQSSPEALAELAKMAPVNYQNERQRPVHSPELEEEGTKSGYPRFTVVAIGTPHRLGVGHEYRVGVVEESDFVEGLRLPDGSLNPAAAHRRFGRSTIYVENAEAEAATLALYEQEFRRVYAKRYGSRESRRRSGVSSSRRSIPRAGRVLRGYGACGWERNAIEASASIGRANR